MEAETGQTQPPVKGSLATPEAGREVGYRCSSASRRSQRSSAFILDGRPLEPSENPHVLSQAIPSLRPFVTAPVGN